jgi:hypothetical protein
MKRPPGLIRNLEGCGGAQPGIEASHGGEQLVEHKWKPPRHRKSAKLGEKKVDILASDVEAQSFASHEAVGGGIRLQPPQQIRHHSGNDRPDEEFDHRSHISTV